MAKAMRFAVSTSKYLALNGKSCLNLQTHAKEGLCSVSSKCNNFLGRANLTTLSAATNNKLSHRLSCLASTNTHIATYSTEVDKEISKFLEKEIQFESSRSSQTLPKVSGFDVVADGGDLTFTKATGAEKIVVRLSVNGAVDSIMSENGQEQSSEPPQMVCKPPFEVELSKSDGKVLALQCSFPSQDQAFEDSQYAGQTQSQDAEQMDDQFEIQEVAIHDGEWKDTTFSVSAATMDAELFDLLMDMLDERGINDEFINQLVDYCTSYENKQYVSFLNSLKSFAEK